MKINGDCSIKNNEVIIKKRMANFFYTQISEISGKNNVKKCI